jgi:hypothetical protein
MAVLPQPLLSIIVPSLRLPGVGAPLERQLLDSLHRAGRDAFEVIWVCNGPSAKKAQAAEAQLANDRPEWLAHLSFTTLMSAPANANLARNLGAAAARGVWLYFIDDDTSFKCNGGPVELVRWLAEKTGAGESGEIAAFGSRYEGVAKTRWAKGYISQARWAAAPSSAVKAGSSAGVRVDRKARDSKPPFLLGGSLGIRADVFAEISGFDPERSWGGCELGLNVRLQQWLGPRGDQIAQLPGQFDLIHECRLSLGQLLRKAHLQGEGKAWAEERHGTEAVALLESDRTAQSVPPEHLPLAEHLYVLAFEAGWSGRQLSPQHVILRAIRDRLLWQPRRGALRLINWISVLKGHWRLAWLVVRVVSSPARADEALLLMEPKWTGFWRAVSRHIQIGRDDLAKESPSAPSSTFDEQ